MKIPKGSLNEVIQFMVRVPPVTRKVNKQPPMMPNKSKTEFRFFLLWLNRRFLHKPIYPKIPNKNEIMINETLQSSEKSVINGMNQITAK